MKNIFENKLLIFICAIVFVVAAFIIDKSFTPYTHSASTIKRIENKLAEKEKTLSELADCYMKGAMHGGYWNAMPKTKIDWDEYYKNEGIAFFLYENGSLVFWSVNDIPIPSIINDSTFAKPVIKLKNGWYRISSEKQDTIGTTVLTLVKAILIKQEYSYENKYLSNRLHPSFGINCKIKMLVDSTSRNSVPVYSKEQVYLFSLEWEDVTLYSHHNSISSILFYLFSFCFIRLLWLFKTQFSGRFSPRVLLGAYLFMLLLLRLGMLVFQTPSLTYKTILFDPGIYADSFLVPSLGDLLLNTLLILHISYLFYHDNTLLKRLARFKGSVLWISGLLCINILAIIFLCASYVVKSLVINSTLSINPDNIINFSVFSMIALLLIGLLALAVFLVSDKMISIITKLFNNRIQLLILCLTPLLWLLSKEHHFFKIILIVVIIACIAFIRSSKQSHYTFARGLLLIILFSLFFARIISVANDKKEKEQRLYFARQLVIEQDYHAEYLFNDIRNSILKDTVVSRLFVENNGDAIQQYLAQKYFSGYWKKYEVQVTACHSNDTLLIQPDNIQKGCVEFFTEKARMYAVETTTSNLFFLNNVRGRVSYLAIIHFGIDNRGISKYLFVEIDSKFVPEGLGYPELLLDFETKGGIDNSNYSYARYVNNSLVNHSGKYAYDLILPLWTITDSQSSFVSQNRYSHLIFKLPDSSVVVLGKPENLSSNLITYFSYVLVLFSILLLISLFIYHSSLLLNNYTLDLKSRVQISMSVVLVFSLLLLGGGAISYIKRIYNNRNIDILSEKIYSVQAELEHKMGKQDAISMDQQEVLLYYLEKFSDVFFSDINLYDPNGNLLASSRSKIFNEGLIGDKMNSIAFQKIAMGHKNLFIHEEHIGSMPYLSAYVPFVNYDNKTIAYLNLPYFAKQTEIQNEVLNFVVTIINSFVLLFVVSIIVALFIANRLTLPLSILQEKMKQVNLGKRNEFIEWQRDDEIGKLVGAYNRMIAELSNSAEMLAKSERESAWKEMAKQVAHEIKNPLTPMKLSIQQLQRAWNDKAPDWDERIKKFTVSMIEQIDTLSSIATAFSNFAKMPVATFDKVDLLKVIENTTTLYMSEKNITISILNNTSIAPYVYADRDQLLRVFSNLIKNACQAITNNRQGVIEICIYAENDKYVAAIKDNGSGIPEEKQSKIFEPNFTTKSSGTGLGLAMSKSIIESFHGNIYFTSSKTGNGTTFFVSLPVYNDSLIFNRKM